MTDALSQRQLRYFTVLADELHFSRAAERLGVPQPALSQQIGRLEKLVGCQLMQRRPRVELTEAGEMFVVGARQMLADMANTFDRTHRAARGETGSLSVGVVASTLQVPKIAGAFRTFSSRYPNVRLEVSAIDTADQLAALKDNRIDIAIVRDPPNEPWLASVLLVRERLKVALPAGHPVSTTQAFRLNDLANEPFILFARRVNPGIHDRILGACREAGLQSVVVTQEVDDVQARLGLVAAGLGWTIVAASVAAAKRSDLVFKSLSSSKTLTTVMLCSLARQELSAPAAILAHLLAKGPATATDKC